MPTLIVEQPGKRTGGTITSRVLIGRLPTNGVVVSESTVSRLHAWIDRDAQGDYIVGDGGSLTGTRVNGRPIEKRKVLSDSDVIRIGAAHLIFSVDDDLPEGVAPMNLAGRTPAKDVDEAGVLFDCPCGTPIWFKATAIGQAHICRHCGRTITIPEASGMVAEAIDGPAFIEPGVRPETAAAPPVKPDSSTDALPGHTVGWADAEAAIVPIEELTASVALEMCSICHTAIDVGETTNACPKCGLTFHAGCWRENLGCSAYGCSQVGVLKTLEMELKTADVAAAAGPAMDEGDEDIELGAFPWEFAFIAVSVAGSLLGALAYGVPALIGAIGTAIYLVAFQESRKRRAAALIALVVCVLGAAGGIYLSYLWWNGWPPIGPFAPRGGRT